MINIAWDDTQSTGDNITAAEWNVMEGKLNRTVTTKTASYNPAVTGDIVLMNGTYTVTLPASPSANDIFNVKNIGTGVVTVARNGNNIDGVASDITLYQNESICIVSDGSNYFLI